MDYKRAVYNLLENNNNNVVMLGKCMIGMREYV